MGLKFLKTLLVLLICMLHSYAQERGVKNINIAVDGKYLPLYKASYALVIGVYDYSEWADLPGVREDITVVSSVLWQHGFDTVVVHNPVKSQLDKAISDFISNYGQDAENRLLIYFAGHGHTIKTSYGEELGYIVPADAPNPSEKPGEFQNKAMEMAQIEIYAKRIQSKHALFLFDACFSGALFALSRAAPTDISYKTVNPVRQFITSGSADETVPDNSIFRQQFVNALSSDEADANKDGYLTGTELGEFLQSSVINYTYNAQHPQYGKIRNPNLDKGDFVFILDPNINVEITTDNTAPENTVVNARKFNDSGEYTESIAGINMQMIKIEGGTFIMGCEQKADCQSNEKPAHKVSVQDFYIGKYEVTQAQWIAIMNDNPSNYSDCDNCPVENISWELVQEFIDKLNSLTGLNYRLPTEAEWEFAAKGGNKSKDYKYPGNSDLESVGWYNGNSSWKPHPVGRKQPNELGLYDMSGNVWEWCDDHYVGDYSEKESNSNITADTDRILRGGSCYSEARYCKPTCRYHMAPTHQSFFIGFRLVLVP